MIATFGSIIVAVAAQDKSLSIGPVSKEYALNILNEETQSQSLHADRLVNIENELRSTFAALPKNSEGHLEHAVVRYAMHRLLMQRHGWFVKGLEPLGNGSASAEWVPEYLQQIMEQRTGVHGFDLPELVVLAATLEDLVHEEARRRLEVVYKILELPHNSHVDSEQAEHLIHMYLMIFLMGDEFSASSPEEALLMLGKFKRSYEGWREVEQWADQIKAQTMGLDKNMDFEASSSITKSIGLKFGSFNDNECRELKTELLQIEDRKPGRVRLSDFYKKGLYTHWSFTEKVDYLRTLGALDETDPSGPSVIVPNYIGSRPQCLEVSGLFAVCCRNECEDLMDHIEREISEPTSVPDKIVNVVTNLSSDTITAPRKLSTHLVDKLREVASLNGGSVPLHGRLFAQWMHHAFPRECPFPHEVGTTNPQTPDEWMAQTGAKSTQASEDEMVCYVNGECSGPATTSVTEELPWSSTEELLVGYQTHTQRLGTATSTTRSTWLTVLQSFNRVVRTLVLAGASVGLVAVSRAMAAKSGDHPDATSGKLRFDGSRWVTLPLFFMPLVIISIDFVYDFSTSNELLICVLNWGLLVGIVFQLVRKGHSPQGFLAGSKTCQAASECWV